MDTLNQTDKNEMYRKPKIYPSAIVSSERMEALIRTIRNQLAADPTKIKILWISNRISTFYQFHIKCNPEINSYVWIVDISQSINWNPTVIILLGVQIKEWRLCGMGGGQYSENAISCKQNFLGMVKLQPVWVQKLKHWMLWSTGSSFFAMAAMFVNSPDWYLQ